MDAHEYPRPVGPPPRPPAPPRMLTVLVIIVVVLASMLMFQQWVGFWSVSSAEPRPVVPRGDLAEDEKTTIAIFQRTAPSVVFITSVERRSDLFGLNVAEIPQGTGSGFLWDTDGHVVTNFHVIRDANAVEVTLSDHTTYKARLVGAEPDMDLAVLQIKATPNRLQPISLGASDDLQVGQKVFAIGNPFGLDYTLTTGVVSALGRTIETLTEHKIEGVIQTDAAINPGNSGGPLLDSGGRLIGVNTAIYSPSGTSAGIGFAVPVDMVSRVVPQVIAYGRVVRPRMGVVLAHDSIMRRLGLAGVMIREVEDGSAAQEAGLRGIQRTRTGRILLGDIIQKVDAAPVSSTADLLNILETHKVGDIVEVTVLRDEQTRTVKVKLQQ